MFYLTQNRKVEMKEGMLKTIVMTVLGASWVGTLAVLLSLIVNGYGKMGVVSYLILVMCSSFILEFGIGIIYLVWNKRRVKAFEACTEDVGEYMNISR
jgi:hypothetical protein